MRCIAVRVSAPGSHTGLHTERCIFGRTDDEVRTMSVSGSLFTPFAVRAETINVDAALVFVFFSTAFYLIG